MEFEKQIPRRVLRNANGILPRTPLTGILRTLCFNREVLSFKNFQECPSTPALREEFLVIQQTLIQDPFPNRHFQDESKGFVFWFR